MAADASEYFVFDANFFITIQLIDTPKFFEKFKRAKGDLGWDFFISEQVFKEIKSVYFSQKRSDAFREIIEVRPVQRAKIRKLKEKYRGSRLIPQDPDLSLAVLSDKLKNAYKQGYVISDDFKLSEFMEKTQKSPIKVLSCGAFLLKVANNLVNHALKRFFLNLRKQVQKAEIEYVLERKDIYPPHQKLSWLIERAISVSEEKVDFQEEIQECFDEDDAEERIKKEIWLAQRVYIGDRLSAKQKAEIKYIYPLLEKIAELRREMKTAQRFIVKNKAIQAMDLLKEVERVLTNLYFAEKAKFITHHTPELLIADELAKANFLHALSSVQIGGIPEAKRFFDNTVFFGLISRRKKSLILMAMLLSALIFVFSNRWKEALEQYELVAQVSKDFGDAQIRLKSLLGISIVQFLTGKFYEALKNLEPIQDLLEKNPRKSPLILEEFGDIFYALGMTDYALAIYREALEYKLELGEKELPEGLIEKVRKCFLIQGIREPKVSKEFSEFMDSIHVLDGKFFDQYDETMAKIFEINKLLYEPFPIFTKSEKKLQDLDIDGIFEWLDIIDVETTEHNETMLIVYSPKLGLLGVQISESSLVIPIPENYRIKFKKDCNVIVQEPAAREQEKYLIRAIIQVETDLELEIERRIPQFYETLLKS